MCGSHRHRHHHRAHDPEYWEATFAAPSASRPAPRPLDPDRPVGDGDREDAVAALRRHAGDGAIDLDEFGARTERVLAARTASDLDAVFSDLPGPAPTFAVPSTAPAVRPRTHRRPLALPATLRAVAPLALLLVGIWALTGMGYFWPIWPLLGVTFFTLKARAHRHWGRPSWV
jgi:hypothetical protein